MDHAYTVYLCLRLLHFSMNFLLGLKMGFGGCGGDHWPSLFYFLMWSLRRNLLLLFTLNYAFKWTSEDGWPNLASGGAVRTQALTLTVLTSRSGMLPITLHCLN